MAGGDDFADGGGSLDIGGLDEGDAGGWIEGDAESPEKPLSREMPPSWQRRLVVVLMGAGVFVQYAMRSNLSVAITTMPDEYDWPAGWSGPCLSAFFWVS